MSFSSRDLLDVLRRRRLLEPEQLADAARLLSVHAADARALAGELIRRGWLTPYQVNQVFQGRDRDLALGSYVLLERLGEGGMGQVFKARHVKLGRVVALKLIRKERLVTPRAVHRFHKEVRAAARLSHPHIVHAYDAEEVGGSHFLVMEYVEGTDLARQVKQHGPLPIEQACEYVRQAALGLQHIHVNGLVHRDIKPHNLLVTPQGEVKMLDLGLARLSRSDGRDDSDSGLTREGIMIGTADYLAPEQALNARAVDIRSDLYSLGCTFYFLLTGRVPFPGDEPLAKLVRHQSEEPAPVEQLRPEVPPVVVSVLRKLMAKRPEDRYQTPVEVAHALAAPPVATSGPLVGSLPATGGPPVATIPAILKRRTTYLAVAGVFLVGFLGLAGVLWSGSEPSAPQATIPSPSPVEAHSPDRATPPPSPPREIRNSLGMKLVRIPAGEFVMGSPPTEPGRAKNEGPPRRVAIRRPFYLGVHLVTVGNFRAFVEATGYRTEAEKGQGAGWPRSGWRFDPACTWRNPGWEQDDEYPVACLSWNDAAAFCKWLSDKEDRTYRLPTEIEWEYACRAGSTAAYGFGDDPRRLSDHAWFAANAAGRAHPVGRRKPNAWGLFDMHGNLYQWCADFYDPHFYEHSERAGSQEPPPGVTRVLRGGSWQSTAADCRCARRGWDTPGDRRSDRGGFRIVYVPPTDAP